MVEEGTHADRFWRYSSARKGTERHRYVDSLADVYNSSDNFWPRFLSRPLPFLLPRFESSIVTFVSSQGSLRSLCCSPTAGVVVVVVVVYESPLRKSLAKQRKGGGEREEEKKETKKPMLMPPMSVPPKSFYF